MGLFTQYKQWIEFDYIGPAVEGANRAQNRIGNWWERFSGGQVELARAEATPANSPGRFYRSTRFTVQAITLEGYMEYDAYGQVARVLNGFYQDRALKSSFIVRRSVAAGAGETAAARQEIKEEYYNCSIEVPLQIEDGDVTRDQDFIMVTLRLQPERKAVYYGNDPKPVFDFDANDQLIQFANP